MTETLVQFRSVGVDYPSGSGDVSAVKDVSLDLYSGETFGLVGESGCGKTTLAMGLMGLLPRMARVSGEIVFQGRDLGSLPESERRSLRGDRMSMVFQDPATSLDPAFGIGGQIAETLRAHRDIGRKESKARALDLLKQVGIPAAEQRYFDPPHRLSGGMRQRVVIAAALANDPALLLADEPTTALDVTIQAQILDLLRDLQREHGTTILLIAHDLGVVAQICDRVGVMYGGQLVEVAPVADLFARPEHPYTRALLDALPGKTRTAGPLKVVVGEVPDLADPPSGCRFKDRCPQRTADCDRTPPLADAGAGRRIACWLAPATRAQAALADAGTTTTSVGELS
jgi:oligopeptide/dipeptide ABC transporter ATP-binding protein